MTRIATRKFFDLILFNQLPPECKLVAGRSVYGIEDVFLRPDVMLRMIMAIEAPPHVEGMASPSDGHLADFPVTGRTADPFADMNAVVKVHKVGNRIHARPQNRFVGPVAFPHGPEHGGVCPYLRMAGHAGMGWR